MRGRLIFGNFRYVGRTGHRLPKEQAIYMYFPIYTCIFIQYQDTGLDIDTSTDINNKYFSVYKHVERDRDVDSVRIQC